MVVEKDQFQQERQHQLLFDHPMVIPDEYVLSSSQSQQLAVPEDHRVKALYDLFEFADLIDYQGGSASFGEVHREMAEFLTAENPLYRPGVLVDEIPMDLKRLRHIEMPRGHLKTTVSCVLYSLWRIYRNPNIRILIGTNLKSLALGIIRTIKQYLENEELQEKVWNNRPHISGRLVPILDKVGKRRQQKLRELDEAESEALDKKIVWRADAIQVHRGIMEKEPSVMACSVMTVSTGWHYDLLILDDIVDWDNASTNLKLERTSQWAADLEHILNKARLVDVVTGEVIAHYGTHRRSQQQRYVPTSEYTEVLGGEVVILGTRYSKDDYYGYLLNNPGLGYKFFIRNIYRNGFDSSDGYIWNEGFSEKEEMYLRARCTPYQFACQYLNKIIADEERVLDKSCVEIIPPANYTIDDRRGTVVANWHGKVHEFKPTLCVDPAISQHRDADNTAIVVGGLTADRILFVLEIFARRATPSEVVAKIYEYADRWKISLVVVENFGYQQALSYAIRDYRRRSGKPLCVREFRPKGEKKTRIENTIQPLLHERRLVISTNAFHTKQLQDELDYFPSKSVKDDCLDVITLLYEVSQPINNRRRSSARRITNAAPVAFNVNRRFGGIR